MVLEKFTVPGRPTNLDNSKARAYCTCSRCRRGVVWTFFLSSITSLFIFPLSGRRPDIDWNSVSQGVKPKKTNNHTCTHPSP